MLCMCRTQRKKISSNDNFSLLKRRNNKTKMFRFFFFFFYLKFSTSVCQVIVCFVYVSECFRVCLCVLVVGMII